MKRLSCILGLFVVLVACKKDKTPESEPTPVPTKWEAICGEYRVFDTTGVFLYEMKLSRKESTDSLLIENFDGQFNLTEFQSTTGNFPFSITIWLHNPIYDTIGNRWIIMGYSTDDTYNNFRNDTIQFYYLKHNTPFWWNDGTQYFHGKIKHIAVKQH